MDQRPKCKAKTLNLLEGNIQVSFLTSNSAMISLIWHQNDKWQKKNIDKLHFVKNIFLRCLRGYHQESKKSTQSGRKYLQYIWQGVNIFFQKKKENIIIEKGQKLVRQFMEEKVQIVNQHKNTYCLISLTVECNGMER